MADAEVQAAADATLKFVVTLSKQRVAVTPVDYATSGSDYTVTSGTLTFVPLQTTKTVSVPILDAPHDEGSETLTLTLTNPSGARVGRTALALHNLGAAALAVQCHFPAAETEGDAVDLMLAAHDGRPGSSTSGFLKGRRDRAVYGPGGGPSPGWPWRWM